MEKADGARVAAANKAWTAASSRSSELPPHWRRLTRLQSRIPRRTLLLLVANPGQPEFSADAEPPSLRSPPALA